MNVIRRLVLTSVGLLTYPLLCVANKLRFSGAEKLKDLPSRNVLFVSNHQTYFADVIALLHVIGAAKWGRRERLGLPLYLLNPITNVFYVAAEKTMKSSWLSRLFSLAGAVTVKRTWNTETHETRKGLDSSDSRRMARTLENNWLITFPQGTTAPLAPGRLGTALLIKICRPLVIPVVIKGFSEAFERRGLHLRHKGTSLSVQFMDPLILDYEAPNETILAQIMDGIGQSTVHS